MPLHVRSTRKGLSAPFCCGVNEHLRKLYVDALRQRDVTVGKPGSAGQRTTRIVAVHKDPPDIEKLARALIELADVGSSVDRCRREND